MNRWALLVVPLVAISAPGCGDTGVETGAGHREATSYQVRGVVRAIGADSLHIRHEAIPDFRDLSGEVVGMEAMSMDFALGSGVSTDGLAPGDQIEFTLRIDWDAERPAQITALAVLSPQTDPGP